MSLVNLFLVGFPKCGTTSLHDYLDQHGQVCMSKVKEPNYFSFREIKDQNLYYHKSNIFNEADYDALFGNPSVDILGESSVSYCSYITVPERIYKYNPKAKIVFCIRNPMERSYSHWQMDYNSGYFDNTFESIIDETTTVDERIYHQIIGLSFYSEAIMKYIDTFGRESVKIVFLEDLRSDPLEVLTSIEAFLGIDKKLDYSFHIRHRARIAPGYLRWLYRSQPIKRLFRLVLPKGLIVFLKKSLLRNSKRKLPDSQRRQLIELFRDDMQKLQDELGINLLSKWEVYG